MPDHQNPIDFEQFMKDLLERLGWSQKQLAAKIDVGESRVSRIIRGSGVTKDTQLAFVERLAAEMGPQLEPGECRWLHSYGVWLQDCLDEPTTESWLQRCERALPVLTTEQRNKYLHLLTKAYGQPQGGRVRQKAEDLPDPPAADSAGKFRKAPQRTARNLVEAYMQMGELKRVPLPENKTLLEWLLEPEHQRMALLAVAGCGKTTALCEMANEAADRELNKGIAGKLPVLVSLGDYSDEDGPLAEWLPHGAKKALAKNLDPGMQAAISDFEPVAAHLDSLRREGQLLLLIDGLNELPGGANGDSRPQVDKFVKASTENQIVVTCRVADYRSVIAQLLKRVELLPFDDRRIYEALRGHLTDEEREAEADEIIAELHLQKNKRLLEVLQVPLYVWAFSKVPLIREDSSLRLPENRGLLLDQCVLRLLEEEFKKAGGAGLPVVACCNLYDGLAKVAYHLRKDEGSRGTTKPLSTFNRYLSADLIGPDARPRDVWERADGAGLLYFDRKEGKVSFWKEPIEELLAGRHMLSLLAQGKVADCQTLWKAPQLRGEVAAPDIHRRVGLLRHPSEEGAWVEPTILAAGLASDVASLVSPDDLVTEVLAVNPWLAGRCIHEGGAQVSDAVRQQVQQTLLDVMQDRDYSVRARVPCGVLLGELGDPRFHDKELFYLPREELLGFIRVPAGPFIMGSDRETVDRWNDVAEKAIKRSGLYNNELYGREQDLPDDYLIALYPVTNAQFRCFVEDPDGGYPESKMDARSKNWTPDGLEWVLGNRWSEALDRSWRSAYDFRREQGQLENHDRYEKYRDEVVRPYLKRLAKDDLRDNYWTDPDNTAANQPVMGATWYEAVAYGNWLQRKLLHAEQCPPELRRLLENGLRVRLPSEPEWEKAARGGLRIPGHDGGFADNPQRRREWSWEGDFDPDRCNTAEGAEAVRWLSPVGMYPDGASPYGCLDMTGNVWEWTRSRYEQSYPYPSDEAGRRDRENPENIGSPVLRGGSWDDYQRSARCAVRDRYGPDNMDNDIGLRLVVSLSDSGS